MPNVGAAMWTLGGRVRMAAAACIVAALAPIVMITSGEYVGPQQLGEIVALLAVWGLCTAAVLARQPVVRA